jgi:hypothetical protein
MQVNVSILQLMSRREQGIIRDSRAEQIHILVAMMELLSADSYGNYVHSGQHRRNPKTLTPLATGRQQAR